MKHILPTCITAFTVGCLLTTSSPAYELHEWGTFTSVSGSNGLLLGGLHIEEERLPFFVHSLDGMQNTGPQLGKGFNSGRPLRNVTIKMETPVLYFYADKPFEAHVKVGFNGGVISQWFPQRSGGESAPKIVKRLPADTSKVPPYLPVTDELFKRAGGIDFANQRNGSIEWHVNVLGKDADRGLAFKSGETLNWVYPRNPKANLLKVSGAKKQADEYEDYLFYRGVGNFPLPVKFTVDSNETLTVANTSKETIPFLFVYEKTPAGIVKFHTIDQGIEAGQNLNIPITELKQNDQWQRPVYQTMFKGLTRTGLFAEEAHGMIRTWWHSYFAHPGLRVFWVVPPSDTHKILPLNVTPAPSKIVRTLVGRSEIIRPALEKKLVKEFTEPDKKKSQWQSYLRDRFGPAYLQRVRQLAPNTAGNANTAPAAP